MFNQTTADVVLRQNEAEQMAGNIDLGVFLICEVLTRLAQGKGSGPFGSAHRNTCVPAWAICLETFSPGALAGAPHTHLYQDSLCVGFN